MAEAPNPLAQVKLFAPLAPGAQAAIAARMRADHFARDSYIFYEDDPADRFWIATSGQVKIVKHGEGGKELMLEMISPGEVFGGATLLLARQPATAQALSDVTTLSTSAEDYQRLLHEYPALAIRVIQVLSQRLRGSIQMRALASERVERRVAHILLKLARKFGQPTAEGLTIGATLSRQDIAELADTTIESAIRAMSRFSKSGWVKTLRGGYVVILDWEALQALSGDTAPPPQG